MDYIQIYLQQESICKVQQLSTIHLITWEDKCKNAID